MTRQILYYRLDKGIGAEKTARALSVSKGTVINTMKRFQESGLPWPLPEEVSDSVLEARLYPVKQRVSVVSNELPGIDYLEKELARKHVTLQCLYDEYRATCEKPVSRASFYRHYGRNRPVSPSMPVEHKGGDLVYVDYSGDGLFYTESQTGIRVDVDLFCCCWGLSSFTYADATETQNKRDFCQSHVRAFRYFGAVPNGLVPDNLKSAVTKYHPFDPQLNPLYEELAKHYGVAVLPARIRKPKDKAKAESAVLHLQRFILARLRNRQFFSLSEINEAIAELLEQYNDRPMKDYGYQTRRERFELLDKPFAKQLPADPFRIVDVKYDVLVGKNYHIHYDRHFYSVPFELVGKRVKVRRCGAMVEIFYDGRLLTRHLYSNYNYRFTTKKEHMPKEHQFVKGLSAGWIIAQATKVGNNAVNVVAQIMKKNEHVQQGFNSSLGVLKLAKVYTPERLESACKRCLHFKTVTYRSIKSVLENNLDQQALPNSSTTGETPAQALVHENLRRNFN